MVGIRSPDGVLGSIPKREDPAPPWVDSRSPDGWDQIPRWAGGWVLHQPLWSFGFDSQTRGPSPALGGLQIP
jgi:hypothetical protein